MIPEQQTNTSDRAAAFASLHLLIGSLFTDIEFRRLLLHKYDRAILLDLPGPGTPFAPFVDAALIALEKRGYIDCHFFMILYCERPARFSAISETATLWGVALREHHRPDLFPREKSTSEDSGHRFSFRVRLGSLRIVITLGLGALCTGAVVWFHLRKPDVLAIKIVDDIPVSVGAPGLVIVPWQISRSTVLMPLGWGNLRGVEYPEERDTYSPRRLALEFPDLREGRCLWNSDPQAFFDPSGELSSKWTGFASPDDREFMGHGPNIGGVCGMGSILSEWSGRAALQYQAWLSSRERDGRLRSILLEQHLQKRLPEGSE